MARYLHLSNDSLFVTRRLFWRRRHDGEDMFKEDHTTICQAVAESEAAGMKAARSDALDLLSVLCSVGLPCHITSLR